jgi:8-oxo-dGTP pyrophosphatase MutT (NUDIX family)
MNVSHRLEFSCVVIIDSQSRFLLQQRDDIPGILHPGKIGLFGGHCESGETPLQCAVREVHEEIGYFVQPASFEHLESGDNVDIGVEDDAACGEFFVARGIPAEALTVTEGSLLIVPQNDLAAVEHKLAPAARFGLRAFLTKQGPS